MKRIAFIIISVLACFTAAMADEKPEDWLRRGDEQYDAGRHKEALEMYLRAAGAGNAEAQFKAGYAFYNGEGTDRDYASAAMWFKRAARGGFAKAEYNLAYCYMNGRGVPRDYDKAEALLKQSAEKGLREACLTLSECYAEGILVEQDKAESERWLARADGKEEARKPVTVSPPEPEAPATTAARPAPPVVKILYPEDQSMFHTDVVKLKYQLIAGGAEAGTEVNVFVDGVKQPRTRAVRQAGMIDVEVPGHDCTVMIYATNSNGNSEPATIRLIRENVVQADMPKLFAVAVGVGEYSNDKLPDLRLTCKDARDFAEAVAKKKGLPFADVQVKLLCDAEATRADIFEAMEWLSQEAAPGDVCMFFFAGHGFRDQKDRFFFMPYHANPDRLYDCFSATDFRMAAEEINSKLLIFVDACYSGGLFDGNRSAAATHFVEQLRRAKNGMLLYASSASDTKSKEDPEWGNGAFTKALVEAFGGGARQAGDEGLSTQELEMYLYRQVRKTTGFKQTPIFINPGGMEHFNIFTYEN